MCDDYGATTYIEPCTLSCIVQPKLTVIDWNTLYKAYFCAHGTAVWKNVLAPTSR